MLSEQPGGSISSGAQLQSVLSGGGRAGADPEHRAFFSGPVWEVQPWQREAYVVVVQASSQAPRKGPPPSRHRRGLNGPGQAAEDTSFSRAN